MIIVIGENSKTVCSKGFGNNVEEAVRSWSSFETEKEIYGEFMRWKPTVIKGDIVNVTLQEQTTYHWEITP